MFSSRVLSCLNLAFRKTCSHTVFSEMTIFTGDQEKDYQMHYSYVYCFSICGGFYIAKGKELRAVMYFRVKTAC